MVSGCIPPNTPQHHRAEREETRDLGEGSTDGTFYTPPHEKQPLKERDSTWRDFGWPIYTSYGNGCRIGSPTALLLQDTLQDLVLSYGHPLTLG